MLAVGISRFDPALGPVLDVVYPELQWTDDRSSESWSIMTNICFPDGLHDLKSDNSTFVCIVRPFLDDSIPSSVRDTLPPVLYGTAFCESIKSNHKERRGILSKSVLIISAEPLGWPMWRTYGEEATFLDFEQEARFSLKSLLAHIGDEEEDPIMSQKVAERIYDSIHILEPFPKHLPHHGTSLRLLIDLLGPNIMLLRNALLSSHRILIVGDDPLMVSLSVLATPWLVAPMNEDVFDHCYPYVTLDTLHPISLPRFVVGSTNRIFAERPEWYDTLVKISKDGTMGKITSELKISASDRSVFKMMEGQGEEELKKAFRKYTLGFLKDIRKEKPPAYCKRLYPDFMETSPLYAPLKPKKVSPLPTPRLVRETSKVSTIVDLSPSVPRKAPGSLSLSLHTTSTPQVPIVLTPRHTQVKQLLDIIVEGLDKKETTLASAIRRWTHNLQEEGMVESILHTENAIGTMLKVLSNYEQDMDACKACWFAMARMTSLSLHALVSLLAADILVYCTKHLSSHLDTLYQSCVHFLLQVAHSQAGCWALHRETLLQERLVELVSLAPVDPLDVSFSVQRQCMTILHIIGSSIHSTAPWKQSPLVSRQRAQTPLDAVYLAELCDIYHVEVSLTHDRTKWIDMDPGDMKKVLFPNNRWSRAEAMKATQTGWVEKLYAMDTCGSWTILSCLADAWIARQHLSVCFRDMVDRLTSETEPEKQRCMTRLFHVMAQYKDMQTSFQSVLDDLVSWTETRLKRQSDTEEDMVVDAMSEALYALRRVSSLLSDEQYASLSSLASMSPHFAARLRSTHARDAGESKQEDELRDLYKCYKAELAAAEEQQGLAEALEGYNEFTKSRIEKKIREAKGVSNEETDELRASVQMLHLLAEHIQKAADGRVHLAEVLNSYVGTNLRTFCEDQIASSRMEKKRLDKTRINYDIALGHLESTSKTSKKKAVDPQKIAAAESAAELAADRFDLAMHRTLYAYQETERGGDALMNEQIGVITEQLEKGQQAIGVSLSPCVTMLPDHNALTLQVRTTLKTHTEEHAEHVKSLQDALAAKSCASDVSTTRDSLLVPCAGSRNGLVYGIPLEVLLVRESREGNVVPKFVQVALQWMEEHGLREAGIFRTTAAKSELDQWIGIVDQGMQPELETSTDPRIVAGAVKKWLRNMPEPLLTFQRYDAFRKGGEDEASMETSVSLIQSAVDSLPSPNRILLWRLCHLFKQIAAHSDENLMTAHAIAIVIAPNILYPKEADALSLSTDFDLCNNVLERMITHFDTIFGGPPPSFSSDPVVFAPIVSKEEAPAPSSSPEPEEETRKRSSTWGKKLRGLRRKSAPDEISVSQGTAFPGIQMHTREESPQKAPAFPGIQLHDSADSLDASPSPKSSSHRRRGSASRSMNLTSLPPAPAPAVSPKKPPVPSKPGQISPRRAPPTVPSGGRSPPKQRVQRGAGRSPPKRRM